LRTEITQTRDLLIENVAAAILLPLGSACLFLLLSFLLGIQIPKNLYSTAVLLIWLGSLLGLLLPAARLFLRRSMREDQKLARNSERFLPKELSWMLFKLISLPCAALFFVFCADFFLAAVGSEKNWKHVVFIIWALTLVVGFLEVCRLKRRRSKRSRQRYTISSVTPDCH